MTTPVESGRSQQFLDGRRHAIKWAIQYLHDRVKEMNDPNAKTVLNCAAFHMGVDAKRAIPLPEPSPGWTEEGLRRLSADLVACGESEYETDPREATIARLSAELAVARDAPKHIEQMTRSLAVELVDGIKEYTMEFSASPRAHRAEYDLVEQKLTEFARAVLAKLSKGA